MEPILRQGPLPKSRNGPVFVCYGHHNKVAQPAWLRNRNSFPHNSEDWKSEIKPFATLVFSEPLLADSHFLTVSTSGFACVHTRTLLSSPPKDTSQIGLRPIIVASF